LRGVSKDGCRCLWPSFEARREERRAPQDDGSVCGSGNTPKTKDPPGGTTGRVKLYGRWGGWALAPYTASLGRDNRSHRCWSQKAPRTFKSRVNFFNFFGQAISAKNGRKLLRGGAIDLADGRFVNRHGGRGRAQIPRCGRGPWLRNLYGREINAMAAAIGTAAALGVALRRLTSHSFNERPAYACSNLAQVTERRPPDR
jgi:hypothetical protein